MNEILSFLLRHSCLYPHSLKKMGRAANSSWFAQGFPGFNTKNVISQESPTPIPSPGQSGTVSHATVWSVSYLAPRYLAFYLAHDKFSMTIC